VAPALAKSHRVISMDMPGHGDSTVNGPVPYMQTLMESAAVIMAALDDMDIGRFDLVGNSLGGTCGVLMAALWPERIRHLGLLSVALGGVTPRADLDKSIDPKAWAADGTPIPRGFEESKPLWGFTDIDVHNEQEASRARAGAWVRASQRGVAHAGVGNYLPLITAPTLLMYGERGTAYKNYEEPGKRALKRGRSVHIPDAGAFAHQDNPQGTEKVLLSFLAEPI
jgi:pimeloyl-ACP methyl ester carboxylesterase